jgi:3-methylfumaryl-CoA hydratase
VFATVEHRLPGIVDEQQIVYREPAAAGPPAAPDTPSASLEWPWRIDMTVDPVVLFRFSALTFNAHRIHYDLDWATRVEGYPGLVVHGPLQAIALAELCRRFAPGQPVRRFAFRAQRPAFAETVMAFCGRPGERGDVELVAVDAAGAETMRATATIGH